MKNKYFYIAAGAILASAALFDWSVLRPRQGEGPTLPELPVSPPPFVDWGLPEIPQTLLKQLNRIHLPSTVDRLDWIPDNIQHLTLHNSTITTISRLPASLETLDVEGARDLQELPNSAARIHSLNIQNTPVTDLSLFFPDLEALAIGVADSTKVTLRLPESLGSLRRLLLNESKYSELLSENLTHLALKGPVFDGDLTIPRDVDYLWLHGTKHRNHNIKNPSCTLLDLALLHPKNVEPNSLELPAGLTSFTYKIGIGRANLPPLQEPLATLRLPSGSYRLNGALPTTLVTLGLLSRGNLSINLGLNHGLNLAGLAISSDSPLLESFRSKGALAEDYRLTLFSKSLKELEPYKANIERLSLCDSDVKDLALPSDEYPNLKILNLSCATGLRAITELPRGLEVLSLEGRPATVLPASLPAALTTLDLRNVSGALNLAQLSSVNTLQKLLLTASTELDFSLMPESLTELFIVDAKGSSYETLWSLFAAITETMPYPDYERN